MVVEGTGDQYLEAGHVTESDMCKHEYLPVVSKNSTPGVVHMICRFCLYQVRVLLVQPGENS